MKDRSSQTGAEELPRVLAPDMDLIGDIERGIGKFVALASAAALAIDAIDRHGPKPLRHAERQLRRSVAGASRNTRKLLKSTRRHLRRHPWRALAVVAAVGVAIALEGGRRPAAPASRRKSPRARVRIDVSPDTGDGKTRSRQLQ